MIPAAAVQGIVREQNVSLARYTTFQLGGPCPEILTCHTAEQLVTAVDVCRERDVRFVLIGEGSNILVSDGGVEALVIRFANQRAAWNLMEHRLWVSGAACLDAAVSYTVERGYDGLLFASGIPGSVGGGIVGNAGAWGRQMSDVLESVTLLDGQGRTRTVGPSELEFSYRHSRLLSGEEWVIEAIFALSPGNADQLERERRRILQEREAKHPDLTCEPCIGSIFRNIEPTSAAGKRQAAGWFLDQAGVKGMRVGGAYVFPRHANIVIKGVGCTAQNVRDLTVVMAAAVRDRFGLNLEREVRFLGEFVGEEDHPGGTFF